MTPVRREKITLGTIVGILGFTSGVLAGVFGSVKTYGADVSRLTGAQVQHCRIVNLEKRAMIRVARAAQERDVQLFAMLGELCEGTGHCRPRVVQSDTIADFPDEECQ